MATETNVAQDQIKAYVDRILRMKEEAKAINADIREIYAEAKGSGFDKTVLGKLVVYVEKRQSDSAAVMETEALFDLYLTAYDGAVGRVGTKRATHTHTPEKPDPIASLKADPAMAIVDPANLKKPEPQPLNQAGQMRSNSASTPDVGTATSLAGAEGIDNRRPITEPQPTKAAGSDLTEVPPANDSGQVADISEPQPAPQAEPELDADTEMLGVEHHISDADKSVEASASAAPAPVYAEPGIVTWESAPPEGVERHEYSVAFGTLGQDLAVIEDDLAGAKAQPIVKMGKVILDGWARYMTARGMIGLDGKPVEYPVVQYDGQDPLMDCIRWNLAGRILNDDQKRTIATRLGKLYPQRRSVIMAEFELGMELVGA